MFIVYYSTIIASIVWIYDDVLIISEVNVLVDSCVNN